MLRTNGLRMVIMYRYGFRMASQTEDAGRLKAKTFFSVIFVDSVNGKRWRPYSVQFSGRRVRHRRESSHGRIQFMRGDDSHVRRGSEFLNLYGGSPFRRR